MYNNEDDEEEYNEEEYYDEEVNIKKVTALELGVGIIPKRVIEPNVFDDIIGMLPSPEIFQAIGIIMPYAKREKLVLEEKMVPRTSIIRDAVLEDLGQKNINESNDPLIEEVLYAKARKSGQDTIVSASFTLNWDKLKPITAAFRF